METNEGDLFEELVTDYGKDPTEEMRELLINKDQYIKSFWLTYQDFFFRLSLFFGGLTLLFYILL